jgi:hypothetical protein
MVSGQFHALPTLSQRKGLPESNGCKYKITEKLTGHFGKGKPKNNKSNRSFKSGLSI